MECMKIIKIDKYEYGIIINALNEMRNQQKQKDAPTEAIEEIMLKIIDSPSKKRSFGLNKKEKGKYYSSGEAR